MSQANTATVTPILALFQHLVGRVASYVLLCAIASLLLWRLWTFAILPMLRPNEPKRLPYWIPYIGHAISFFRDADAVLSHGRFYFRNTPGPFSVTVAGKDMVILTHPQEVADAYKIPTLYHDDFVRDFFNQLGVSPIGMRKMFQDPRSFAVTEKSNSMLQNENPLYKCFTHYQSDLYKGQLHPGKQFEVLQAKILRCIDDSLQWDHLPSEPGATSTISRIMPYERTLSLSDWCREVIVKATTRVMFGDALLHIDPKFLQYFYDFDDESWKLTYQLPRFLSKDVHAVKDKILDVLVEFLKLPPDKTEDACWLVKMLVTEQRNIGIGERDIAAMLMVVFWVSSTNAHKLTFWILAHSFHSPCLLQTIQTEIAPAFSKDRIDLSYLLTLTPHLTSLYHELLRLNNSAAMIRDVETPITIGGKHLRKGMKILSPFRQMHLNQKLFGDYAEEFDAERFLKNKALATSKSYKPFGGGSTMCPGRFVARAEIYTFITLVLHRFDAALSPGAGGGEQAFPALDRKKPSLGVMGPIKGQDVLVTVRPRSAVNTKRNADVLE